MKNIYLSLTLLTLMSTSPTFAQGEARDHGGGNGGDDFELELKKRSLQIGHFLKSSVGTQTFKSLNADAVIETINATDIDVTTGNVMDKYGTLRTCVNEPERSLITCNLNRLMELKKKNQNDILTAILFHEILGIMGIELGHQENVSMYPISSKIIPYHSMVESTQISEGEIRPEYYGLDNSSYGMTVVNKKNKESLRMICLNDNVEVHRCRNFSVVRSANGRQAPLVPEIIVLTPSDLTLIKKNLATALGYSRDSKGRQAKKDWDNIVQILNLDNNLTLINKKVEVKDRIYNTILKDLTKAVSEKINSVIRAENEREMAILAAKRAEAERIAAAKEAENQKKAAWQNRKDHEPMKNIGAFSLTLKKDLILIAKTQSHRLSTEGPDPVTCDLLYPVSEVDRMISANTMFNSIEVQDSPTNEFSIKLKFQHKGIPLEIKCEAYYFNSTVKASVATIGVIKRSFVSYMTITLADPVDVK